LTSASVVIPTRDRPASLARCLAALGRQGGPFEVVVVDDGSGDATAVARVAAEAGATLIRRGGNGPAAARNAGAGATGGSVICFLDDDCEPAEGWLTPLVAVAAQAGAAAGTTVNVAAGRPAAAAQAITNGLLGSSLDAASGRLGFAPSCNLAVRRDLFEAVAFDESFPLAAGEDRDWSARAGAAGHAPLYVPEAVVLHRHELSAGAFLRQQFRYGRGGARYRSAALGRRVAPASFYRGLAREARAGGPGVAALLAAAQVATAAGALAEAMRRGSPGS
jgi:GT2 family glycosyltransferase